MHSGRALNDALNLQFKANCCLFHSVLYLFPRVDDIESLYTPLERCQNNVKDVMKNIVNESK